VLARVVDEDDAGRRVPVGFDEAHRGGHGDGDTVTARVRELDGLRRLGQLRVERADDRARRVRPSALESM
jgi:hypothetical protein